MATEFDKNRIKSERMLLQNPIGHCGHHCWFCFLAEHCTGCRSEYNCCSFATLFPDGVCPNTQCVSEKGIDGCYECTELSGCNRGYYGRGDEYVAKATALFIRKYGKQSFTETLKKAIESGEDYPKSFDVSGSVNNAMDLLTKYL